MPESPKQPTGHEVIIAPIDSIAEADAQIIQGAKGFVLALGWEQFGQNLEEIGNKFDARGVLLLTGAPFVPPINVIFNRPGPDGSLPRDRGYLLELLPHQKQRVFEDSDDYWLVMAREDIPPDLATHTRDYLALKGAEEIARLSGLDVVEVVTRFAEQTPWVEPMSHRFARYMRAHPEIYRPITP